MCRNLVSEKELVHTNSWWL